MSETHDYKRLFFGWLRLDRDAPAYSIATCYEVSDEEGASYRGSKSVVLRVLGPLGLMIGWWEDNPALAGLNPESEEYDQAVRNHLENTLTCTHGPDGYRAPMTDEQIVRIAVGNLIEDPNTEWTVLCMMGLESGEI